MNRTVVGIMTALALLSPATASAQPTSPKFDSALNPTNATERQAGMYEDIEVMRRLLNEKLAGYSASAGIRAKVLADAACTKCHSSIFHGVGMVDPERPSVLSPYQNVTKNPGTGLNPDGTPSANYHDPYRAADYIYEFSKYNTLLRNQANAPYFIPDPNQPGALAHYEAGVHRAHIAAGAAALDTEGTYLKGHGIVYTLTLSPTGSDPRPQAPHSPPKPLGDWERIRGEIRQEKPPAADAGGNTREPTLGDIVVKLLADNGKHFSQLKPEESLTVVVTFRAPRAVLVGDGNPILLNAYLDSYHRNLSAAVADSAQQPGQRSESKNDSQKPAGPKTSVASTLDDYLLLADLHIKQNKAEEAIKAYLQALEMKPDDKQVVTILGQLQRAYRQAKKEPEARLTEQKLKEFVQKREDAQIKQWAELSAHQAKPTGLPGKLVICATKKQLDDVGNGKMSFEDFKKAASVEYVTFPAEKK
jgi:tetratricopeptide (TPR) repeat protein